MLTYERANELFRYDRESGFLVRKKSRQGVNAGEVAGTYDDKGYVIVCADYRRYKAHRIAWLLEHGDWPKGQIDHVDGDPANNRISNLRDVTGSENNRNRSRCTRNKSGVVGVQFHAASVSWRSSIKAGERKIELGKFCCLLDAAAARKSAEMRFGFSSSHGSRKTKLRRK